MIRTRFQFSPQFSFEAFKKGANGVLPVSQWNWSDCSPLVNLKHDPMLLTPHPATGLSMLLPQERVFCEADVTVSPPHTIVWNNRQEAVNTTRLAHLQEMGIDTKGIRFSSNDGSLIRPKGKKTMETLMQDRAILSLDNRVDWNYVEYRVDRFISALPMALNEEKERRGMAEANVDILTWKLVQFCGFNSIFLYDRVKLINPGNRRFPFGGIGKTQCRPDFALVGSHTPNPNPPDLVLFCVVKGDEKGGLVAKIFGEGLYTLYHNFDRSRTQLGDPNAQRSVHIVRLMGTKVSFFRLDADGSQVCDVCMHGMVPLKKMTLLCDVGNASRYPGGDLCDRTERRAVMQKFADLRSKVIH